MQLDGIVRVDRRELLALLSVVGRIDGVPVVDQTHLE
jgi:hypothetical protein